MKRTRFNLRLTCLLLVLGSASAGWADEKAEAVAKADYEAAEKSAREAEAQVGPLRDVLRNSPWDGS